MKITGPCIDRQAKRSAKRWYLSFRVPKKNPDGTFALKDGKIVRLRTRPHYETKSAAEADILRLRAQHSVAGVSPNGILTRAQAEEYEQAKVIAPEASMVQLAQCMIQILNLPAGSAVKTEGGQIGS